MAKSLVKIPIGKIATKEVGQLSRKSESIIKQGIKEIDKKSDFAGRLAQKRIPKILNEIAQAEAEKYGAEYKTIPINEIKASFQANRELSISKIEQIVSDIIRIKNIEQCLLPLNQLPGKP